MHCLETLDMRKTKIEILPVEVIKLPHLVHLLGKFKLGKRDLKVSELGKFLPPKESNLQTLAGFITDNNPGFPMLMLRMKKLRKVKIWCGWLNFRQASRSLLSMNWTQVLVYDLYHYILGIPRET